MEFSKVDFKKVEFLAAIIVMCTVVAMIILIIDFQTKAAILDQVTRWEKVRGQENTGPIPVRNGSDSGGDRPLPSDLVDSGNARMEARGNSQSSQSGPGGLGWVDVDSAE